MSKKKKQEKQVEIKRKAPLSDTPWYRNVRQFPLVLTLVVLTFICFSPILSKQKEFINFDDPVYITHQDLITKLDGKHLKTMFTEHDASLNYHPLTMLSLAVNYHFSQLRPYGYFLTNLLIHILNTILVFIFLYRLSGKKFWTGLIAATLFSIHPMHVESVAWASERKDVLYCFFFLASCITYLTYLETKRLKHLTICFVFFLFSCLSKAMAVPLPVILLLIDFYKQRKFSVKLITEKIPFFLLSLVLGYVALKVQSKGAISSLAEIPLSERFIYGSYGFIIYFEKLAAPFSLCAFYSYPPLALHGGYISIIYKIAPALALLIILAPLIISYKKNKELFRLLVFGIGFFVLMIALVLQFISVGAALMADRYSYLPYIGIFFIIAISVNDFFEKQKTKIIAPGALIAVTAVLGYLCFERVTVWQNDVTIWSDVIEKCPPVTVNEGGVIRAALPEGTSIAYLNRANYYRVHDDMDNAFNDYELVTRYDSNNEGAFNNLGNIYCIKAQDALVKGNKELSDELYTKAINTYSAIIRRDSSDIEAIHNRGITYSNMGDHLKALDDFNMAARHDSSGTSILASRAFEELQLGMFQKSIDDYSQALSSTPDEASLLFYRGTAYINAGKFNDGISDLSAFVKTNPLRGDAWYNLSFGYSKINNRQMALEAAMNAKKNGYTVSDQYLENLRQSK